jgi:hypothetical protein
MEIAVVSEDFRSITGKAGKARRFLLFAAKRGKRPKLERYLELDEDQPTYHDLHEDDETSHPLDGMVLITGEAGEGFRERLARRSTQVYITSEKDPHTAVELLLEDRLPTLGPTPKDASHCA